MPPLQPAPPPLQTRRPPPRRILTREKQRQKGKPVLRSFPDGPARDEAIFFDTRGAKEGASSRNPM